MIRRRTLASHQRRLAAALAIAAIAALAPTSPAAADSFAADSSPQVQVTGTYTPLVGNFSGDQRDDILWYAPGSGQEWLWIATGIPSQPFTKQAAPKVNGTYLPLVGNFGGDAYEEVLWYAPGTTGDVLWRNPAGYFQSQAIRIDGTFRPLVLENPGAWSAIFWYAPGAARDALWQFQNTTWLSTSYSVNGTDYRPFVLDQNGDFVDDIFWYAPGAGADTLWLRKSTGGFNPYPKVVNGTYSPLVGEWGPVADNQEDILWSNPTGNDVLMVSDIEGQTSTSPVALPNGKAVVAESPGRDVAYFFGAAGGDRTWRRDADGSTPTETQVGYDAATDAQALAGLFSNTSSGSLFFYRPGSAAELYLR
jgi:hypothetical protein